MNQFGTVGKQLRELRHKRNLLQTEVAKLCRLYQGRISEYETGKRLPTVLNLLKLSACFELYPEQVKILVRLLISEAMKLRPNERKSVLQSVNCRECHILMQEFELDTAEFYKLQV